MPRSGKSGMEEVAVLPQEATVALRGTNDPAARDAGEDIVCHSGDRQALECVEPAVEVAQGRANVIEPIPDLHDRVLARPLQDDIRGP